MSQSVVFRLQDARGPFELIKAKVVFANFTVKKLVIDLYETDGDKCALTKSRKLQESIHKFAAGNSKIIDIFRDHVQASAMWH